MRRATDILHGLFQIGILAKGVHGLINLVGAALIYATSGTTLANIAASLAGNELSEDPNDILANLLLQTTSHVSPAAKDFAALYLFVAAIVNIVLSAGLLANKRGAFPVALAIMSAFVVYQIYLFAQTRSPWLIALALYDCFVIGLVYFEYRRHYHP